ncbi:hemerythrin domain-containing protein [Algicella marina]|uniref:Hemerythrin domain-containing protein n=1 Tax=Algicella marina TaxID=2683284 RepID=A0A6P1T4A1_9RHOB|nr:hemerythrin domain-containing protein [Algicella marina]QHQ36523.1 hemerythrin domain-containing protein [Algicella marina]
MQDSENLALSEREGLPDALRVLTAEFDRDAWADHPNFSGLISFWLDRHLGFRSFLEAIRQETEAMLDGRKEFDRYRAVLSRRGSVLLQELHGHHTIEDQHYFPVLQKLDTRLERGFDILEADHHALDPLLQRFAERANGVLQSEDAKAADKPLATFLGEVRGLESLLDRHLVDEEDLVVPVLLKYAPEQFV